MIFQDAKPPLPPIKSSLKPIDLSYPAEKSHVGRYVGRK